MTTEEIKQLIDNCFDAVDKSRFGPLMEYPDTRDVTQKQFNQLAFGVFTIVLTGLLRQRVTNDNDSR